LSEEIVTKLNFLQGYKFIVEFDVEGLPKLLMDEPKPAGEGSGPGPTRLLSAAVGHCLSTSLLYCLQRAKVRVKGLEMTVKTRTGRNDEGRLRVKSIDVQVDLDVDEGDAERVTRCLGLFENYCTVTPSVRKGVEVNVNVRSRT
jgi:uncharacterized OsmC-like protein